MTAHAAIAANASAAAPPIPGLPDRTLTLEQQDLVVDFFEQYDIAPEQISFDGDQLKPIFDFDALFFLANRLGDFQDIAIDPADVDDGRGYCTSNCMITLPSGRTRRMFGSAFVGESMPGGGSINRLGEALLISRSRALRGALRSVGFDPLKAHLAAKAGEVAPAELVEENPRRDMERAAHLLGEKLGYIVKPAGSSQTDKTEWKEFMAMLFQGRTSMADLTDEEQSQWVSTLRAMERACRNAVGMMGK